MYRALLASNGTPFASFTGSLSSIALDAEHVAHVVPGHLREGWSALAASNPRRALARWAQYARPRGYHLVTGEK